MIKVNFDVITPENYDEVCTFYNKEIPTNSNPLQKLNRIEGGFKILLDHFNDNDDANLKIKQVRWKKKHLATEFHHFPFTDEETQRLFLSFQHVFGKDKVELVEYKPWMSIR